MKRVNLQIIDVAKEGCQTAVSALRRTTLQDNPQVEAAVREIVEDVRARGDTALLELGRRFDSSALESIHVTAQEWDAAQEAVDAASRQALEAAAGNIIAFHERQRRTSWLDVREGVVTGQLIRPLQRVGLYIPGGTAVYPSTVLMCALPARVAGVPELVLCTPCTKNGTIHPLVLFAAKLAGVSAVYKVGGAQAVAAMAFGTQSIPAVDKVVGPGNVYVNVTKRLLWGVVDIDMLAGPSEVCVVADDGADPVFVAADMLAQAEHDVESAAYLITSSAALAKAVEREIQKRLERMPRREILRRALEDHGAIIITETIEQAYELADVCAPEHLALMVRNPLAALGRIRNAGAILMGDYAPQTLGDYLAGPSHTLPTGGTARFASPLHVDTFLKKSSFIYYTPDALKGVAPHLRQLADAEGFEAHAAAVRARIPGMETKNDG
ncbi:MAG TPA: histidinol dehydrogenase [Chthonomonadales bacterium]|nr:histidinol dehydrogenase [Chthonomonadales bacterium]